MKAIILAAGKGTRLKPLTNTVPKPLTKILGKELIFYTLDLLVHEVDECTIVVNYKQELFKERIGNEYKGIKIHYHIQGSEKGTGGAIKGIQALKNEEYLIIAGDQIFYKEDIQKLISYDGYAALATQVSSPEKYGIFQTDTENKLLHIIEKPRENIGNLANISCYKLSGEICSIVDTVALSPRGEIEITDAINIFCQYHPVHIFTANFIDLGYPWHLLDANTTLLGDLQENEIHGIIEDHVHIHGNIILKKGAVIKSGSYIEGNCYFGENSIIGPNAYIRGNTSLGAGGKIGFGVEVKNSYIGENSKIPHLSYLGDSIVGNNVNLGGGFKVANLRHDGKNIRAQVQGKPIDSGRRKLGCIIGDHVKTAINTQVYPGRTLDTSSTTFPGEIIT